MNLMRIAARVIQGSLKEYLIRRMGQLFSSWSPQEAADTGKWFEDTFRINSTKTPKGQKDLKEEAKRFVWILKHGPSMWGDNGSEKARIETEQVWESKLKTKADDLVKFFSDAGGTVVPKELKVGSNTFINQIGFNEATLAKYAKAMEQVFDELRGWRKKALSGGVTVVFADPKQFNGTVTGKYKRAEDLLLIRATPHVLKRTKGTYAAFDYIVVHELGHRYENKNRLPEDFDRPHWWTSRYSKSEGEAFSELFAISNFDLKGTWDPVVVKRFDDIMG
jgi:hypothetical protein